jgi:hypothetical protein
MSKVLPLLAGLLLIAAGVSPRASSQAIPSTDMDNSDRADDKQPDITLKVGDRVIDKYWGSKYKSHTVEDGDGGKDVGPVKRVKILLEFTRDIDDREVHREFRVSHSVFRGPRRLFDFCLLDGDNVVLAKLSPPFDLEGEVTGKKGDGFRVVLSIDPCLYPKVRKIEARGWEAQEEKRK